MYIKYLRLLNIPYVKHLTCSVCHLGQWAKVFFGEKMEKEYCTRLSTMARLEPTLTALLQALREQFMDQYHLMRCHSLCMALYGLAAIDNPAHRMRPTFQALADVAEGLVEMRDQLKMHHISLAMYAFGK